MSSLVSIENQKYRLVVVQDVTRKIEYREKYQMLFEHSLDGIMLTRPNGDILEANKAACDILGMTEEEIIDRGRDGIVAKDDKLQKALEERSESGKFSGELTYIHKSGRPIPVEVTSSVFTNYAGEKRTSLIFRDITDKKENQKALRSEKEFNEVAINSMPGTFFVLNEQGQVIRWNKNVNNVLGLSDDEIEGLPASNFVHESDKQLVVRELEKVFEEGHTSVELTLKIADGETATYQFVANRIQQEDQTYIIGSGIDISQQKELENKINALLEEESRQRRQAESDRDTLAAIFEKTPSPKCMLQGPEFRFAIANQAYCELVGQRDILGKKLTDVAPELVEQGYIDILNKVYETGEPYFGNADPVKIENTDSPSAQDYVLNMVFQPLLDNEDNVYGIFVEAVDLSDQFQYQQELRESLKEKEILLAEIHHRVKNNLAIVSSMMELQAMKSSDEALEHSLKTSQQRIQTIAIIHEVLYQSENLSHIDFKANTEQLISNLQKMYDTDKIAIQTKIDPIVLNINQAIPCALIINEVVANAFKHAFEEQDKGNIRVIVTEEDQVVTINIADNGSGIPDNIDPENSTSLGMTLIQKLSQQLGAHLEMHSDNGTIFTLTFEQSNVKGIGSALTPKKEDEINLSKLG